MRNFLKGFLLLICLCGFSLALADETAPSESAQETATTAAEPGTTQTKTEKKGGFSLFLIVFVIAMLFVLSSATALKSLGGKPPGRRNAKPAPPRKLPEGGKRFRL